MATYFKIGACDEELNYGEHKPIPQTIECCCCDGTTIDIFNLDEKTPLVEKDKEDTNTDKENEG